MAKFSARSNSKLAKCHPDLRRLAEAVVKDFDCTVVTGYRGKLMQTLKYKQGLSKVKFPNSKHNSTPSMAIDLAPYIKGKGCVWEPRQCYYFSGFVIATAHSLGIKIRTGADWDMDNDVNDQEFRDACHFELVE